jgi:dephospho-CoA kinase
MTTLESPRFCSRFCVGLSGGIASGKSTVAQLFADLGAAIVDTDVIAHQLTRHNGAAMPAIAAAFGAAFVNQDGSLNRVAMRARVFANPSERQRLETILHPMINAETRAQGASVAGDYVMFVVPLLVESAQWRTQVDRFLIVDCPAELQRQRLLLRPTMTAVQADQILAVQAGRETRLAVADDVIYNSDSVDIQGLKAQVQRLHLQYTCCT